MAVKLLELTSGDVSLEFDRAEQDEVTAVIVGLFGEIATRKRAAVHNDVEFGGESFVYYHEWDPCLISLSAKGSAMLRSISANFQIKPLESESTD